MSLFCVDFYEKSQENTGCLFLSTLSQDFRFLVIASDIILNCGIPLYSNARLNTVWPFKYLSVC